MAHANPIGSPPENYARHGRVPNQIESYQPDQRIRTNPD